MKALSVKQPLAVLLCEGIKTIEVRSWKTDYRGDLLICASAAPKNVFWADPVDKVNRLLPAGCILGVVELVDIRPMVKADDEASVWNYVPGAYAWVTRPKRWTRPDKITGRLSLFDVPDDQFVLLDADQEVDWTFNYPPPQGAVKFTKSCPVLDF